MRALRFVLTVVAGAAVAIANDNDFKKGMEALYTGRYPQAVEPLSRAYKDFERAGPPRQMEFDAAAVALSSAYQYQGRLDDAERIITPLVTRWRESKTPYLIAAVDSLASVYALQGKSLEARQLATQSVEFAREHFGADHRTTRGSMMHLANLDAQQGRLPDADDLLSAALESARRSHVDDAELVPILTNVGKLKVMRQDYKGAIDSLREAVFLAGKLNGQDLVVAETTYSLAAAYYQSGHPERAEPLVKAAIAKYESIAGPDSPALGGAIMLQADVALSNRRVGVAEKQLNRAVQLLTTAFGPEDVEVAVAQSKLGELCLATNRPAEAERLLSHAIPILERAYGVPHPRLATALSDMAELLALQGSYEQAAQYYKRAINGFEASAYRGEPYMRTLEAYGRLLDQTNKREARDVRNRAKTMSQFLLRQNVGLDY